MSHSRTSVSQSLRSAIVIGMAMVLLLPAAFATAGNGGGDPHSGAYLGVHVGDLTPEQADSLKVGSNQGALVLSIDQDGPACKAGLKSNDVIVALNGNKVQSPAQLADMMRTVQGGKVATLTVVRDGSQRDIKVTLGSRHEWMTAPHPPVANTFMATAPTAPLPPVTFPADVEVPVFTPASSRRGLVVEALTAQLAEFFGVPRGQGVLVRNVQKGSIAANSGLKAGDVIIKINGDVIRDLADWRRSMNSLSGKGSFSIIRDKREQVVQMSVPGPASKLKLGVEDWDEFGNNLDSFNQQMQMLGPELQRETRQAMMFKQDELDKMQREIEKSMKHQAREVEKSMRKMQPQMKKQAKEIQKQMDQMRPELDRQMQEMRKQMEQMGPEIQKQAAEWQKAMTLKQEDIEKMRREVEQSMKTITPQIQQQMEELRKEMEQHKFDLHEMMKNWPDGAQQPNQF